MREWRSDEEEDVCGDGINGFRAADECRAGDFFGVLHYCGVEIAFVGVIPRGDCADCVEVGEKRREIVKRRYLPTVKRKGERTHVFWAVYK